MAENKSDDLIGKGIGMAVALGALALGVATALMNNERSRQMRAELQGRVDDLGRRVDDLSAQARHRLDERRPDIEQGIQRGRQAAVEGLEKVKSVMEQGAEKAKDWVEQGAGRAQDMVQRATNKGSDVAHDATNAASDVADEAGERIEDVASDIHDGAHGDAGPGDGYGSGGQETVRLEGDERRDNPPGY